MLRNVTIMLVIGLLLTGCATQRQATKYFNKHGFQAAKYCNSSFPMDTTYKIGTPLYVSDTTIKIDSVPCAVTDTPYYVEVPQIKTIIKRSYRIDTLVKTNTALREVLEGRIDSLKLVINENITSYIDTKESRNKWRKRALITWLSIGALSVIGLVLKRFGIL